MTLRYHYIVETRLHFPDHVDDWENLQTIHDFEKAKELGNLWLEDCLTLDPDYLYDEEFEIHDPIKGEYRITQVEVQEQKRIIYYQFSPVT